MSRNELNKIENGDALIKLLASLIHPSTIPIDQHAPQLEYALSNLSLIKTGDELIKLLGMLARSTSVLIETPDARKTIIAFGLKNLALIKTDKQLFSTLISLDKFACFSEIPLEHRALVLAYVEEKIALIETGDLFILVLQTLEDLLHHWMKRGEPPHVIPDNLQTNILLKLALITTATQLIKLLTLLLKHSHLFSAQTQETLFTFVLSKLMLINTGKQLIALSEVLTEKFTPLQIWQHICENIGLIKTTAQITGLRTTLDRCSSTLSQETISKVTNTLNDHVISTGITATSQYRAIGGNNGQQELTAPANTIPTPK